MPNEPIPAADTGLPNLDHGPGMKVGDLGLEICRSRSIAALRPTVLSPEYLDEFLAILDRFLSYEDKIPHEWNKWRASGFANRTRFLEEREQLKKERDDVRRKMTRFLKMMREAQSKNIDDILFKAYVADAVESSEPFKNSLSHSLLGDLLASDCWRA